LFLWKCVIAVGQTLGDLCFNVGHWLLAIYYFNMATNMPIIINHRDEGPVPVKNFKPAKRIGAIVNSIVPLLEGVFMTLRYYEQTVNSKSETWINNSAIASFVAEGLLQIFSGVVLVTAIFKIRSFILSSGNNVQQIDLKALLLHSSAFILYELSNVINMIFLCIWVFSDTDEAYQAYECANSVNYIFSFCSQCLLCIIMWQLGTKIGPTQQA